MLSRFGATAPSNIALIKYMGKKDVPGNLPENASLSMTLDRLCTFAEVSVVAGHSVSWVPELPDHARSSRSAAVPALEGEGLAKVIRYLERLRAECPALLGATGLAARGGSFGVALRTANTFPASSGIASSASSYAAITLAMAAACAEDALAFERAFREDLSLRRGLARLSRTGSGSSCRSFEGPFVLWKEEQARAIDSGMPDLAHFVLIVSDQAKSVSSSRAHAMVKTSPLWVGRPERAEARLALLERALARADVAGAARLAWEETWEMHSLFHTSSEPFSYWEPGTIAALRFLAPSLDPARHGESPPIVTLDAGPNVHLIVESRLADLWRARLRERFPSHALLEDIPGRGAGLSLGLAV